MVKQPIELRKVNAEKVREWLLWFGEHAIERPTNTEIRRLNNRLSDFSQRAGATTFSSAGGGALVSPNGLETRFVPGFDWEHGEIAFAPRDGFGARAVERMLARIAAVTGIRE